MRSTSAPMMPRPVVLFQGYRSLFSEAYRQLQSDINGIREAMERSCGEITRAELKTTIAHNLAAIEFWQHHCAMEANDFPSIETALTGLRNAHGLLLTLIDRKLGAPLELIDGAPELDQAGDEFA